MTTDTAHDHSKREAVNSRGFLWGILAISLIALLTHLNGWGVLEASEARYAEISREMFRSGDLIHPTLLNIYHYHKPPVTFWLTALGFHFFGVNAFGARFFLQLSLVAQGALTYGIGLQLFGGRPAAQIKALLAAIIYLSLPLSVIGARNLTTDCFLTTWVLCVIYAMAVYYCQRRVWGIYSAAIAIGLGFLTKGPAIFVVPFFVWLYLMLGRRADWRVPLKHLVGALILCLGLGLSWYGWVAHQVPGLGDYFIGRQVVARVADDDAFDRAKPDWYYPLILLTTTLPWGLYYLAAGCRRLANRLGRLGSFHWRAAGATQHLSPTTGEFLLYWFLLPLLIFGLSSSKLMLYLLPIYPGLALMMAHWLWESAPSAYQRLGWVLFGFYQGLGLLLLFGPWLAGRLGQTVVVNWPMVLVAIALLTILPMLHWGALDRWLQRGIVPSAVHASEITKTAVPRLRLALTAWVGILLVTVYASFFLGANELLVGSTRPVARFIQAQGLQEQPVLVYGKLLPSLAFNLDRDIRTISDGATGNDIARESEFQRDDRWYRYWLYPERPGVSEAIAQTVRGPSVWVSRGDLPAQWEVLVKTYPKQAKIGRWQIYYRRQ